MRSLYIDLDDTYKDTERYIRRILLSEGVKVPAFVETVYDLLGYNDGREYVDGEVSGLFRIAMEYCPTKMQELCSKVENVFKDVMQNYEIIPNKQGADICLDLLKTEYNVVMFSAYTMQVEKEAKRRFAESKGIEIIQPTHKEKKSMVLDKDGILVDNDVKVLNSIDIAEKYLMYCPYSFNSDCLYGRMVTSWYDLCDYLMEVDVSSDIRADIYKGIPVRDLDSVWV